MNNVEFPAMRREVLAALAALSDGEYQQRVWVEKVYPTPHYYDDLTANVHILYDDCQVLPEPVKRLSTVLLAGAELERLRDLESVLGPLVARLRDAPDSDYLADQQWPEVISAAGRALSSMVLAGCWWPGGTAPARE